MYLNGRYSMILQSRNRDFITGISVSLVREVIKALPYDFPLREKLLFWIENTSGSEVSVEILQEMSDELATFTHSHSTELGQVGRLPRSPTGRIVENQITDESDIITSISSAAVLSLALRRLTLLRGIGDQLLIVSSISGSNQ